MRQVHLFLLAVLGAFPVALAAQPPPERNVGPAPKHTTGQTRIVRSLHSCLQRGPTTLFKPGLPCLPALRPQPVQPPRPVAVVGRVMRPGCWPFKPGLTAGDALTQSGGADRFGEVHRVLLVRRGQPPCLLDLAAPPDTYTPLQPGDILMVDDLKPWEP